MPALIEALGCSHIKVKEFVIQGLKDIESCAIVLALINCLNVDKKYKSDEALIEALTVFDDNPF